MNAIVYDGLVTAVRVVLTDGEFVYDERNVAPVDLGWLNKLAQAETDGELWWETAVSHHPKNNEQQ